MKTKFKVPEHLITNDQGKRIILDPREQKRANYTTRVCNALGYEIPITTLTTIMKKITEQKFFNIAPGDYLPIKVGEGSWSSQLTTYRSFEFGQDFASGVLNLGGQNARLASADAGVDSLSIKVFNWGKEITWSIMEMEQAAKAGNWDVVVAKEKARKKNFDLGVQATAFLGLPGQNGAGGPCLGLLNQGGVTINTTTITKAIKTMTPTELKTFTGLVVQNYRANSNYTAWPTHFVIPESDYNGLAAQSSPEFPVKSVLELLLEAFKITTRNKNFQILPLAYADYVNSDGVLTKQRYTLYNFDEESIRMDLPVSYTQTIANSVNNFQLQNVGYAQFTGVLAYRPQEILYFEY